MLGTVKGNYELRIAVIDMTDYAHLSNGVILPNKLTEDEEFLSIAEQLGTVYSLGGFIEEINDQELYNLTNCYVRAFLINKDDPEEIISVDSFNTLYLYNGEIKQR